MIQSDLDARQGSNIFIGHGRSMVWRDLKDFVTDRLKLPYDEFNAEPVAGITNTDRLTKMMRHAAFAFRLGGGSLRQGYPQLPQLLMQLFLRVSHEFDFAGLNDDGIVIRDFQNHDLLVLGPWQADDPTHEAAATRLAEAARRAGLDRKNLWLKLKQYGIARARS